MQTPDMTKELAGDFEDTWPEHDPPIEFRLEAVASRKYVTFIAKSRTQFLEHSIKVAALCLWNELFPEEVENNIKKRRGDPKFRQRVLDILDKLP